MSKFEAFFLLFVMAVVIVGFVTDAPKYEEVDNLIIEEVEIETNEFLEKVVEGYPRKLLDAMYFVESTNGTNMDGEAGSLGPYQIRKLYWIDATDYDKSIEGKYEDCIDKVYSEKIIWFYAERYELNALYDRDIKTLAKLHNGGPSWKSYPKDSGKYWKKIKNYLDNY